MFSDLNYKYINPKKIGISAQNEPYINQQISAEIRQYPDMYAIYSVFYKKMHYIKQPFILGNGCENIIKTILVAIKPKSMFWFKPAWAMIDVFCDQLNIKKINAPVLYTSKKFIFSTYRHADVLYTTWIANNLFTHDQPNLNTLHKKYKWVIVDLTYCSIFKIKQAIKCFNFKNVIFVGSFDKIYGCGLRLGFCFFNKKHSKLIFLHRERYINAVACNFILSKKFTQPKRFYIKQNHKIVSKTFNYLTIETDKIPTFNYKCFSIDNKKFIRICYPSCKNEQCQFYNYLNQLSKIDKC